MIAAWLSAIIAAASLAAPGAARQESAHRDPDYICGRWRVQGVVATAPTASSADVVKPFFGVEVVYTATEMRFGSGVPIAQPSYTYSELSDSELQTAFEISFANLRVKGTTTHIVSVRERPGVKRGPARAGTTVIVRNDKEILVPWEGHFMELIRTGAPCGR